MLKCCVLVGLDWVEPMMFLMLHITCSCIHTFISLYSHIKLFGAFSVCPFLSLFLSLVALWHLNENLLHPRTLFIRPSSSSSPFDSTPSHVWFRDDKARKDFSENLSQRGIHSKPQVILSNFSDTDLPTIIYSRSWESLCGISVTCPSMIIQEFYSNMHRFDYSVPHFVTRVRGTRIVVTPDIESEVLHVPRVTHPDYPGCNRLRTISKDKLSSLFDETLSSWSDYQNTPCSSFAKDPRFLNMVMTFVLHPLSHYNSITEPHAQFLLSLLERLTIDFSSHFILSLVYRDMATCDKLIFPSAIMRILCHFFVSYLESPHFLVMCAIDAATVKQSEA